MLDVELCGGLGGEQDWAVSSVGTTQQSASAARRSKVMGFVAAGWQESMVVEGGGGGGVYISPLRWMKITSVESGGENNPIDASFFPRSFTHGWRAPPVV